MILFFDTETTGLIPGRIIQLSYVMVEKEKVTAKNFFFEVDYMPPQAEAIHGFSVEKLKILAQGKTFFSEMDEIEDDFCRADLIVAHNVRFDIDFMIAEFTYAERRFKYKESFDTLKYFTPILKLEIKQKSSPNGNLEAPSKKRYKYPKLSELADFYEIYSYDVNVKTDQLFGCGVLASHDARYDVVMLYLAFEEACKSLPELQELKEQYY